MKTCKKIALLFLSLCAFQFPNLTAQEFFVSVNPSTGIHTRIDSIPGVRWIYVSPSRTTIDKVNNRYYFWAQKYSGQQKFYTIDANTGAIIKENAFPSSNATYTNVGNFEFDDSTGEIYGVGFSVQSGDCYFIKMDTASATMSSVSLLPGVTTAMVGNATYDQSNHRYIFVGNQGGTKIITVSALSGSIVSAASTGTFSPVNIRYNNATAKLYGWNFVPGNFKYLAEWNLTTGVPISTIYTMTMLASPSFYPNQTSIDEINNRYTFLFDPGNTYLMSIELSTGNIIHSPTFPVGLNDVDENVIELHYNNTNGFLYGLHWNVVDNTVGIMKNNLEAEGFEIFPNPVASSSIVRFDKTYTNLSIKINNSIGEELKRLQFRNVSFFQLDLENLAKGIYYISASSDEWNFSTQKFIVK